MSIINEGFHQVLSEKFKEGFKESSSMKLVEVGAAGCSALTQTAGEFAV